MAGLVQTYEFTFELCWKTLKDKLVYDGYSVNSPREAIRQAFGAGLIGHIDCWFQALESRNLFVHTYDDSSAEEAVSLIKGKFFSMNSIFNNVPLKENGLYKPSLQNYWHVLSSGDSFTNSLPSSPAMPFEVSGNLPDQEVVELVDMVRPKEDDPIADIRLQDDGRVVVMTATSRAFLAGRGKKLLFEKKNGKWVLVEECNWMS